MPPCLKWQRPEYAKILLDNSNGKTDYLKRPAEDFARSLIEYKDENGERLVVETTTPPLVFCWRWTSS